MTNMFFKDGTFKLRGKEVSVAGQTLPIVEGFKVGVRGGYVTVDGAKVPGYPDRNIKIMVTGAGSVEDTEASVTATVSDETDEEVVERLRERFSMLTDMTKAVKKGDVRAMIVSGPPGVGKSHGVEEVLDRYAMMETLGARKTHEVIKGAMSALGLKAALDSKKNRKICWNTDSFKLRNEGVPDQFTFKASAIFITNLKFDKVKGKLREHLEALESRCHYMDLTIDTDREKMLRIRQVTNDGMLDSYRFDDAMKEDIIDFVDINKNRLRELSLRSVLKVADLAKAFPTKWEAVAENTVMRRV